MKSARKSPSAGTCFRRRPKPAAPAQSGRLAAGRGFLIVGLGASAGGLEALEEFFVHAPPDGGMAFVVVTHQHPGHVSLLGELLRKHARLPVTELTAPMRVEPNQIYMASPEGYLAILSTARCN